MVLPWRRRRASRRANQNEGIPDDNSDMEVTIPSYFQCPISLDLMRDPVTLSTGITYDRENIERWIEEGNQRCPVTNQVLTSFDQIPNHAIRRMIQDWCVENRSSGIERIPTPRTPVTDNEVSEIRSRIERVTQRGDQAKCQELVGKIKQWGKESERNKRCIVENGVGCALAGSFHAFASESTENNAALLEEILSVLTWMFPLGAEGQAKLGSLPSLRCLVGILTSGDLSASQNAALVLKQLVSLDQTHVDVLMGVEGVVEALVGLIKEPICAAATKASLGAIYCIISPSTISNDIVSRFVEIDLVPLIVEVIVDAEKGICEKALGVLDRICECQKGREDAYKNSLLMPLLVKKILRVSDLATQFIVSILWKLCAEERGMVVEALQVGAFQKLLVLLQVGCSESTKEKVTELLKWFNPYRGKAECFESSMNFKYLKRGF